MDNHGVCRVRRNKSAVENQLNDYYRRRCVNYERFLCDRVWECALCARQSGKIEPVSDQLPIVAQLRKR